MPAIACGLLALAPLPHAVAQAIRIERCEPATFQAGGRGEITLGGRGLDDVRLWSSFPAEIERSGEGAATFSISTGFTGTGAIRAHGLLGASNLFVLEVRGGALGSVIRCEQRQRPEDAQPLPNPAMVEGSSMADAPTFYRFPAIAGEAISVRAAASGSGFDGVLTLRRSDGRRLAFNDDSDTDGADPRITFTPAESAALVIELSDSQYRGGLPFRLSVGAPEVPPARQLVPEAAAAQPAAMGGTVFGRFDARGDRDVFALCAEEGQFLTITPRGASAGSPARVRATVRDPLGKVIAQTPQDTFDERPLRLHVAVGGEHLIEVEEAFGRAGEAFIYGIDIDANRAPFDLAIPDQPDKNRPLADHFVAVPGGVFVVPVQCQRQQFDDAITLHLQAESQLVAAVPVKVEAEQGSASVRVRAPGSLSAGDLATFRINGHARVGDVDYCARLHTRGALRKRNPEWEIPDALDGQLALAIVPSPLQVEVSPPGQVARGGAAKVKVKLVWAGDQPRFNAAVHLRGAPGGVAVTEAKLDTENTETELEIKPSREVAAAALRDLRVEVTLDYHGQPLIVPGAPFTVALAEPNDDTIE